MRADTVGAGAMLARIVAMVAEAQRSRAPIQKLADTVAGTGSCPACSPPPCWPSPPGRSGDRRRRWHTP